jgi:hypothetical protein
MATDQSDREVQFLQDAQTSFNTFKSIVLGLERHLFPPGRIRNEASDVEIADKLLNNDDIEKYLTAEFLEVLRRKLALKAQGIIKQAETDGKPLGKFAASKFVEDEK